eukprot:SAG31_NODE_2102_length_6442_cov_1.702507_5_plen_154_part_00
MCTCTQGFVRVPELISGSQLRDLQKVFVATAMATAAESDMFDSGGSNTISLVEHIGEFLPVLTLPSLLELVAELMPTRYEGLPQCVSLTARGNPSASCSLPSAVGQQSTVGWQRDYTRPVRDIVLYGHPAPPQYMADALKVFIALRACGSRCH